MKLLTKELEKKLPALYSQEKLGEEALVLVHFFNPTGVGDWWISEGTREPDDEGGPSDLVMFGYCDLGFPELGYVSLNELQSVKGRFGLGIERDLHWVPKTLREVMESRS